MKKLTNYGKMLICMALVLILSVGATIGITMTYFGDSRSGSVEIKIGASIYFDETNGVGVAVQDGITAIVPSQSVDVTTTLLIKSSSDTNVTKGVLKVIPDLTETLEGVGLTLTDGKTYDVYLGSATEASTTAKMVVANNSLYLVKASNSEGNASTTLNELYEITPSTSGLSVKFSVPVTFSKDINNDLSGQSCTIEMKGVVLQSDIVDTDGNAVEKTITDFEPYFTQMAIPSFIYFGSYPQTIKADNVTITSDPVDENGYYTGSDGEKYAKVTANMYGTGTEYQASDGTQMVTGADYYFKVEPLKWRVLSNDGSTALIVCDQAITAMAYGGSGSGNNYKNSKLRAFLIGDFYGTAFSASEQTIIQTTNVDNSAASAGSSRYTCENTDDKIFALSYAEAKNANYGFSTDYNEKDSNRTWSGSDYAKANYIFIDSSTYNSYVWLRSPVKDDHAVAKIVDSDGSLNVDYNNVYDTYYGVAPALNLSL